MGEDAVRRARALLGVRFRPQGRDPAYGVDCIGVVAVAFGLAGVRRDYEVQWGDEAAVDAGFAASGFVRVAAADAGTGDVMVVRVGAGQLHVVVLTGEGFVHADVGLRRVVEVPGSVGWPVVSAWRSPRKQEAEDPHPTFSRRREKAFRAGEG